MHPNAKLGMYQNKFLWSKGLRFQNVHPRRLLRSPVLQTVHGGLCHPSFSVKRLEERQQWTAQSALISTAEEGSSQKNRRSRKLLLYSDCGSSDVWSSDSDEDSHVASAPLSDVRELMELISKLHCEDIDPQCDLPEEVIDEEVIGDFL